MKENDINSPSAYQLLSDTYKAINRVEDKLDTVATRVGVLEVWRAEIVGRVSAIVAIVSIGVAVAWDYIKSRFQLK